MINIFAGALLGAFVTLGVTWWLNRNTASRSARRETYVELLTMLKGALRSQRAAIFDHGSAMPELLTEEQIDAFNARLELDASREVRDLTAECFKLVQQFNVSHVTRTPIQVDDHGLFQHQYELVRGVDEETAGLRLRLSLGRVHDELDSAVGRLAARVRREVHGAA